MNTNPLLSVVAPMFNTEKYIARFIECIRKQSYENWELILVDDGSTDSTIQIVEEYCKKDERIILKKRDRDPKNADTCRNIGQSLVSGKYMIVFDSDDIVEPYCFQQRVEYMENHQNVDFATFPGASVTVDETNGKVSYTGKKWGLSTDNNILKCFLEANYPYAVWDNIYKAELFKNQLWDERIKVYQDFDYIITTLIGNYSHAFSTESKVDYLYCVGHPNAITAKYITNEKFESTIYLFEKTVDRLNENKYSKEYLFSFRKFFLLQFERIALTGTDEQLIVFTRLFKSKYRNKTKRVAFCSFLFTKGNIKTKNMRGFFLDLMFHPGRRTKKFLKSILHIKKDR